MPDETDPFEALKSFTPAPRPDDPFEALKRPTETFAKEYVDRSFQNQRSWSQVEPELKNIGVDPEQFRQDYQLQEARAVQKGEGAGGTLEIFGREFSPFSGISRNVLATRYTDAIARFKEGKATTEDAGTIARFERIQELNQQQASTFGGKAVQMGGKLSSILGEAAAVGPIAGKVPGGYLARQAAATALMPSLYQEHAAAKNISEGRSANDIRGFPSAVGLAYAQNLVLGKLPNIGARVPGGLVARSAASGAGGTTALGGIDVAAGVADEFLPKAYRTDTKYGTFGKLLGIGQPQDVKGGLEDATLSMLGFSLFAALHDQGGPSRQTPGLTRVPPVQAKTSPSDAIKNAFVDAANHMQENGYSKAEAQAAFTRVHNAFKALFTRNQNPTPAEARKLFEDYEPGPLRDYAHTLADALPTTTTGRVAQETPQLPSARRMLPEGPPPEGAPQLRITSEQPNAPAEPPRVELGNPSRVPHISGETMTKYPILRDGNEIGEARVIVRNEGKTLHVEWIGEKGKAGGEKGPFIGPQMTGLLREIVAQHPAAEFLTGLPIGGRIPGERRIIAIPGLRTGRFVNEPAKPGDTVSPPAEPEVFRLPGTRGERPGSGPVATRYRAMATDVHNNPEVGRERAHARAAVAQALDYLEYEGYDEYQDDEPPAAVGDLLRNVFEAVRRYRRTLREHGIQGDLDGFLNEQIPGLERVQEEHDLVVRWEQGNAAPWPVQPQGNAANRRTVRPGTGPVATRYRQGFFPPPARPEIPPAQVPAKPEIAPGTRSQSPVSPHAARLAQALERQRQVEAARQAARPNVPAPGIPRPAGDVRAKLAEQAAQLDAAKRHSALAAKYVEQGFHPLEARARAAEDMRIESIAERVEPAPPKLEDSEVKLTDEEKFIVAERLKDPRPSYDAIGKALGLARGSVEYRHKQALKKMGEQKVKDNEEAGARQLKQIEDGKILEVPEDLKEPNVVNHEAAERLRKDIDARILERLDDREFLQKQLEKTHAQLKRFPDSDNLQQRAALLDAALGKLDGRQPAKDQSAQSVPGQAGQAPQKPAEVQNAGPDAKAPKRKLTPQELAQVRRDNLFKPISLLQRLVNEGGMSVRSAKELGIDVASEKEGPIKRLFREKGRHIEDIIPELQRSGDLPFGSSSRHLHDLLFEKLRTGAMAVEQKSQADFERDLSRHYAEEQRLLDETRAEHAEDLAKQNEARPGAEDDFGFGANVEHVSENVVRRFGDTKGGRPGALNVDFTNVAEAVQTAVDEWSKLRGQQYPAMNRVSPEIADRAAALTAAKAYAEAVTEYVLSAVFGKIKPEEAAKLYTAHIESRLNYMRGQGMNAISVIGPDSPIKTNAEFRQIIGSPEFAQYLQRWKAIEVPIMDKHYNDAQGRPRGTPIHTTTQLPHFPINLVRARADGSTTTISAGGRHIKPERVTQKRLGFNKAATGEAPWGYETDPRKALLAAHEQGAAAAARANLDREIVARHQGEWARPGQPAGMMMGGKRMVPVRYVNPEAGTQTAPGGQANLNINSDLVDEYHNAIQVGSSFRVPILTPALAAMTRISVASTVEAMYHSFNILRDILHPFVFRNIANEVWHAAIHPLLRGEFPHLTDAQLKRYADAAEIGGTKEKGFNAGFLVPDALAAKFPILLKLDPTRWSSELLDLGDKMMRLAKDGAFEAMARRGRIPNTPGNKRDFMNTLGQYKAWSQAMIVRILRGTGVGPFATAATNSTVQAIRSLWLSPGVTATSAGNNAKLRLHMALKLAAALGIAKLFNWLVWGRADGDDNTPFGGIKVGETNGRTYFVDPLRLLGPRRGLHATGADAVIEGKRVNASDRAIFHKSREDVTASFIHPMAGPGVSFGYTALKGKNMLGVNQAGLPYPQQPVPFNTTDWENFKAAMKNANPSLAQLMLADRVNEHEHMPLFPLFGRGENGGIIGQYPQQTPIEGAVSKLAAPYLQNRKQMSPEVLRGLMEKEARPQKSVPVGQ